MKNIVIVDIDTERTDAVIVGKPADIPEPTSLEEAKVMVDLDIKTITEALVTLVAASHINNFSDKDGLIKGINNRLLEGVKQYTDMVNAEPISQVADIVANEPVTEDATDEDVTDITNEEAKD